MQNIEKLSQIQTTEQMKNYMNEVRRDEQYALYSSEEQGRWLQALQKHFILMLEKGELPAVEMTLLYSMFDHKNSFAADAKILSYRAQFLEAFQEAIDGDRRDSYVLSAVIVVCDFLNGHFAQGLKEWIQRTAINNSYYVTQNDYWALYIQTALGYANAPIDLVTDAIEELLDWERYIQLSALSRRSILSWCLSGFWNIKHYFNSTGWLKLYPKLKILSDRLLEEKLLGEQMAVHFFVYHIYGNNAQTQEEWTVFSRDFDRPEGEAFLKYADEKSLPLAKKSIAPGRKKIIIVKDRIVNNSVFKVEYSLFKSLLEDETFVREYELSVLSLQYIDKSSDDEKTIDLLKSLGVKVSAPATKLLNDGYYYDHLQKAELIREYIIAQSVDIMIVDAGCFDISNFLFATRSAPKQIYWSHGNYAFDAEGIDLKIAHGNFFIQNEERCGYLYHTFPEIINNLPNRPERKEDSDKIRLSYPKDAVILGSIGRLVKLESTPYLNVVTSIMKEFPKTIYLACGVGNIESIKKKIKGSGVENRFYFTGQIDANIYVNIIDIFMDSFPLHHGVSAAEYISGGHGVICRPYISENNDRWNMIQKMYAEMKKNEHFLKYISLHIDSSRDPQFYVDLWKESQVKTAQEYIDFIQRILTDEVLKKQTGLAQTLVLNYIQNHSQERAIDSFIGLLESI